MPTRGPLPVPTFALAALVLLSCSQPDSEPSGEIPVRVLLAYSDSDTGLHPDYPAVIRSRFAETQEVFRNSRTGLRLELAALVRIPYRPEERLLDLARLVKRKDGHADTLHTLRDRHQADLVAFISPLPNATVNASVLATDSTAFVIVAWEHFESPIYGLAHELAHLFGAMHPGTTGPVADQFPQGFPWGNDTIKTVLDWSPGRTLPCFSNPDLSHRGVALGIPGQADIASVIRTTAAHISNFRGPKTPTSFTPAGTLPTLDFTE